MESTLDWMELRSFLKDLIRIERRVALKNGRVSRGQNWFIMACLDESYDKDTPSKSAKENMIAVLKKATDDPFLLIKNYANFALKQLEKKQD